MLVSRHTKMLAALIAASLTLAACGGGEQPQQPARQTGGGAQQPTAEAPKPTETPQQDTAGQPTGVLGTIAKVVKVRDLKVVNVTAKVSDQRDVLAGLGSVTGDQPASASGESKPSQSSDAQPLSAYRLTYRLDAEYGGKEEPLTLVTEVDAEGRARYDAASISDGKPVTVTLLRIDQTQYSLFNSEGEDVCITTESEQPESIPRMVDWLAEYVEEAELAEEGVEVNGFLTDRYTFKQKLETSEIQAEISGEVWVARGLNIVVRHRGESIGKVMAADNPTEMQDARVRWAFDVERLESDFVIEAPEACLKGADLPIPTGAKNLSRMGDITSFQTDASVSEVVDFYKEELEKVGWKLVNETTYGDSSIMNFEKGDQKVLVMINVQDKVTQVLLMLE